MRIASVLVCLAAFLATAFTDDAGSSRSRCNKIYAVFTFEGVQYFIYSRNGMKGYNFEGELVYDGKESDMGWDHLVRAAVGVPRDEVFYLLNGDDDQAFKGFGEPTADSLYHPAYHGKAYEKLIKDKPREVYDAAFRQRWSDVVYFAGCNYVIVDAYHMDFVAEGKNEDLGLPCNVDAAWTNEDQTEGYISKRQDLYVWKRGEDKVTKKNLLEEFSYLKDLDICE